MALNALGLGMIITAKDTASAVFAKAGVGLKRLGASAATVSTGIATIGTSIKGMAMGFAPFTLAMGMGIKTAAGFEQGMANVKTIMRDITAKEFTALSSEAKRMGATTSFTARQAADGMQVLARQGLSATQILSAIEPTLKAAEVEGISLATSAQLISSNMRAFGMQASQAGEIAGVLALASAKSATSMVDLGEGLKYAAPTASMLKIPLADTVAGLSMLANVGIRGSEAGTALNAMMTKLATASPKVTAKFKKMGIQIKTASGEFVGLGSFSKQLNEKLPEIGGNMDQVAFLAEAMGRRGLRGASTLQASIKAVAQDGKGSTNAFRDLQKQLLNTGTTVQDMAADKLNTLQGQLTIMGSSIEGVVIESFKNLVSEMKPAVATFATWTGGIAEGLDLVNQFGTEGVKSNKKWQALSTTQKSVVLGMVEGFKALKEAAAAVGNAFSTLKASLGETFGQDGLKTIIKWGVVFGGIAAVIAPVAAAIGLVGFVLGPVIGLFKGLILVGAGILKAVVPALLAVGKAAIAAAAKMLPLAANFLRVGAAAVWAAAKVIGSFMASFARAVAATAATYIPSFIALAARIKAVGTAMLLAGGKAAGSFAAGILNAGRAALAAASGGLAALTAAMWGFIKAAAVAVGAKLSAFFAAVGAGAAAAAIPVLAFAAAFVAVAAAIYQAVQLYNEWDDLMAARDKKAKADAAIARGDFKGAEQAYGIVTGDDYDRAMADRARKRKAEPTQAAVKPPVPEGLPAPQQMDMGQLMSMINQQKDIAASFTIKNDIKLDGAQIATAVNKHNIKAGARGGK